MSGSLDLLSCGSTVTVQDDGRIGWIAKGLSRGGAADMLALREAEALLGHAGAAVEMGGFGGVFRPTVDVTIALTGAPMRARCDGAALMWSATHEIKAGQVLEIGAVERGAYGYLSVLGGIATTPFMGSRATHLVAGIGAPLAAGDQLPLGQGRHDRAGLRLPVEDRFSGGTLRAVRSAQSDMFSAAEFNILEHSTWRRGARGNRQGVALEGARITGVAGLNLVSETIAPGDIQITGDGTPFVLLGECQTAGGYPRIGTIIPPDVPKVAQAGPNTPLRIKMVPETEALDALRHARGVAKTLANGVTPIIRAPEDMPDLLSYSLISGVTSGRD